MPRQLWDYWIRSGGSNTRYYRLSPVECNPIAIRILCALISGNKALVSELLQTDPKVWMLFLLGVAHDNALASFLLERVYAHGLRDVFSTLTCDAAVENESASHGVWTGHDLATNLQRMAAIEISRYDEFENRFVALLDALSTMSERILWPKGISLSRTVYSEPFHRTSGDFDCILRKEDAAEFIRCCAAVKYTPVLGDPGFCNQLEVGPTASLPELFAAPSPSMVPSAVLGLARNNWPLIDPKFNPLDRGLACKETDRFFRDSIQIDCQSRSFQAPSLIDHLIIASVHCEKDRFRGWKSLIDIHLLVGELNKQNAWPVFVERCRLEGASLSAWSSLILVHDRFGTEIPADVMNELMPTQKNLSLYFSFTVEPLFYWNCASLVTLYLNALFTGDRQNKLPALRQCFSPTREFIALYYGTKKVQSVVELYSFLAVHWLIVIMPGLLIRRTFGRIAWPASRQYVSLE
jgi:hypothetical protein